MSTCCNIFAIGAFSDSDLGALQKCFTYLLTYLRHPDAHVSAADQRMHIFANEHLIEPLVSVELCVGSRRRPGKRPDSLHPIFAVDEASDPATSLSDHAVAVSSSSFTDMSLRHVFGL